MSGMCAFVDEAAVAAACVVGSRICGQACCSCFLQPVMVNREKKSKARARNDDKATLAAAVKQLTEALERKVSLSQFMFRHLSAFTHFIR
jgi:hypothetical protein